MNDFTHTKPKYYLHRTLPNSWIIKYGNEKEYIVDETIFEKILNYHKQFIFHSLNDIYPFYGINNKYISLPEFIYNVNPYTDIYTFKNGNKYDLRACNVTNTTQIFYDLTKDLDIIKYFKCDTIVSKGKYAGQIKNPMCETLNKHGKTEYLMLCNQDKLVRLCPESYQKILDFERDLNDGIKIIWSYHKNGYILGNINLYIHQVIMCCFGAGKGTKNISVDHIDQDPLNNRLDNLRLADRKQQEANSKGIKSGTKRERKSCAQDLPEGITHDMLRKYVTYNKECYNKEKNLYRDFFRVEKHPNLKKLWSSSKSNKINILDKLASANLVVDNLDKGILPENESKLPKYITLKKYRGKPHLIYDRKIKEGGRHTLRMVLPESYTETEQLGIFREKIEKKYNIQV